MTDINPEMISDADTMYARNAGSKCRCPAPAPDRMSGKAVTAPNMASACCRPTSAPTTIGSGSFSANRGGGAPAPVRHGSRGTHNAR